ncbi:MAG: hypothetical protein A3C49_01655 [Candidatus Doudnabacteria bacterium RIFCSPHIGHO2_02_FULL_42_25]|uniref:Uncharacterized protein n=1 Tax=Candidatus Doudnabacteria bacterium RIFCSPHIGHO2_01_FULL_41_86 TaxID=1817821 RepID=A0A1F5N954_9BACT|nr:MAG: hypothetical protein A2717_01255 [Candidatus Doudnabacteria bacterium RIFCSPHIGHO2_01_FULL_41_86]OGE74853.1 MAG: hypothetical protein A3K07_02830 [Candidatus Doudnabacteria bacterium RIFCSPHIGHO2_01_43_10]OGE85197.1 MAG: hypothetical protein A3E28_00820 [Candidatus Doudnabacteria bacterium RIFCSPHIGHO2_12_FULL_42_22]OGE86735.1 MAG: hypothetical protein A3C49_01655 [Candidatus Doudnabacteria bacterium RIFCSPHIGHO2_02_FULL_42_25]OGE92333.1 MAG: hypothetical protein A2895_01810 [Candidatus
MTIISKSRVRVKPYIFGFSKDEEPVLKVGLNLESVGTKTTQLASLVYTLVKFELIRRDAYSRWRKYLNEVGLRLQGLISYMNVLYDDDQLIYSLKSYYYKSVTPDYDKLALLREANELLETLKEKVEKMKLLSEFQVQSIRNIVPPQT